MLGVAGRGQKCRDLRVGGSLGIGGEEIWGWVGDWLVGWGLVEDGGGVGVGEGAFEVANV